MRPESIHQIPYHHSVRGRHKTSVVFSFTHTITVHTSAFPVIKSSVNPTSFIVLNSPINMSLTCRLNFLIHIRNYWRHVIKWRETPHILMKCIFFFRKFLEQDSSSSIRRLRNSEIDVIFYSEQPRNSSPSLCPILHFDYCYKFFSVTEWASCDVKNSNKTRERLRMWGICHHQRWQMGR